MIRRPQMAHWKYAGNLFIVEGASFDAFGGDGRGMKLACVRKIQDGPGFFQRPEWRYCL